MRRCDSWRMKEGAEAVTFVAAHLYSVEVMLRDSVLVPDFESHGVRSPEMVLRTALLSLCRVTKGACAFDAQNGYYRMIMLYFRERL